MIQFNDEILFGSLVKRYKRFFMDIELSTGETVVAHTPNTGSMLGLLDKNNVVMIAKSNDPKRKTAFTTQAIKIGDDFVGINTQVPNKLVKASLAHDSLAFLSAYDKVTSEVAYGPDNHSRIDLLFSEHKEGLAPYYVELKNVTLKIGDQAQFPDAPSVRAQKHVSDLMYMKKQGFNAALIFIVQRQDCHHFSLAAHIDETYARMVKKAHLDGLVIKAICAKIDKLGVRLTHEIPCIF